jgi:hypothetical protein
MTSPSASTWMKMRRRRRPISRRMATVSRRSSTSITIRREQEDRARDHGHERDGEVETVEDDERDVGIVRGGQVAHEEAGHARGQLAREGGGVGGRGELHVDRATDSEATGSAGSRSGP